MAGALIPYGMQAGRAMAPAAGRGVQSIQQLLERLLGPGAGGQLMERGIPGMSRAVPGGALPGGAAMRALPGPAGGMSGGQLAGAAGAAVAGGAALGYGGDSAPGPSFDPRTMQIFDQISRNGQMDNSRLGAEPDGMGRVMQPSPPSGGAFYGEGDGMGRVMQGDPEVVAPQRVMRRPEMLAKPDERNRPEPPTPPKRPANLGKERIDYQSNNRDVRGPDNTVNWGDSDNAADFFRADKLRMKGLLG